MNKKKLPLTILICVLFAILLTGCVDVDAHVKLNADLSGTYELTFLTSELANQFMSGTQNNQINQTKEKLAQQGFQIQEITQGEKKGWKATKNVDNFIKEPPTSLGSDLQAAYQWATTQAASLQNSTTLANTNGSGSGYSIDWGLFFSTLKLDAHFDPSKMQSTALNNIPEQFKKIVFDKMNLRFILTLPVEATDHNATSVSEDGKTLTWKMNPTGDNHIYMAKDIPNPFTWGIIIIFVIVLLIVMGRKKRKRRARRAA
ncbi:DUF3153 domain-containing protein [Thermoflavimicrobium daqui]|uniref:DUF3153 domain-containing protein n=1 Tax=Thermoflavimicrobium daqui TaxID=2137476 RepID=UPI00143CF781|nr:DUF3153 domain-containing protein [Thermoflavimicrobium daqui]